MNRPTEDDAIARAQARGAALRDVSDYLSGLAECRPVRGNRLDDEETAKLAEQCEQEAAFLFAWAEKVAGTATEPPTTYNVPLLEIARLRAERDKLIEMCVHDLRLAGYQWGWTLGLGFGRADTREEAIAAVREAAGLPREES